MRREETEQKREHNPTSYTQHMLAFKYLTYLR